MNRGYFSADSYQGWRKTGYATRAFQDGFFVYVRLSIWNRSITFLNAKELEPLLLTNDKRECMVTGKLSCCSEGKSILFALCQCPFNNLYLAAPLFCLMHLKHSLKNRDRRRKYFHRNSLWASLVLSAVRGCFFQVQWLNVIKSIIKQ